MKWRSSPGPSWRHWSWHEARCRLITGPRSRHIDLLRGHYLYVIVAHQYFAAIDDYGSPAYSVAELQRAPPEPRQAADLLLLETTGLGTAPAPGRPPGDTPPTLEPGGSVISRTERGCLRLAPQGDQPSQAVLTLPPGGLLVRGNQDEPIDLRLRRFGDDFALELGATAGHSPVAVTPPPDAATNVPWRAQLDGVRAPLLACGA